jgi:hypothetical protein
LNPSYRLRWVARDDLTSLGFPPVDDELVQLIASNP